ncbi:hypothetical protein A2348_00380 [Candidatus Uhrbacteria bacterium RIFOXYB12_FULL_58_10]|uniref:DUF11 domain-containing protein n=1 Tax=Candidatus Uhrbacteria bacterium RIFOXYB2_FULL_57_15 TaxID=1802422 RepID=A0A1F7W6T9_9BACT|nr:MAG: hypothetical protein A2348_00380 [Candidatus Uhrbacteria bacterium RIFOXYB12_FULL_58_10]OGL98366.1 MAG: hypothetical protein A2304_01570 [Candidatus Uhrbacteria bacterium RIFOXYB2_FULL_57_15]OGM00180.1 MAG: hypothetical protein A2501_01385 [Candidatus Uhrbacteria bacterium RIFOXYC12_FULL_57_11]
MSLIEEFNHGIACNSIKDAKTVREKAVCLAAHPGRIAVFPLVHWFEKRYRGKYRFARLTFLFDLVLVGIAIGLGLIALAFAVYTPTSFADHILFQADVAPHEIVSGAPSTLVIRYKNDTGEELRDAKLLLNFPAHFLLQELEHDTVPRHGQTIDVGTIPPDAVGSVKIRGVMFGDVGGKQTFVSTLTFTHGEKNVPGTKTDEHVFIPSKTTLGLSLFLPKRVVASQSVEGSLTYRNSGDIDYPEIMIEPEWPDGFAFISSDVPLANGVFRLPAITAGTEGTLAFTGTLGDTPGTTTFRFHPSFAFGEDLYRQETLTHDVNVIPLPLQVSHSVDADTVRPGGAARITVTYTNISDESVTNVRIGVESQSPFARSATFAVSSSTDPKLASVAPGESGIVTVEFPLRSSVSQSATDTYEQIPFSSRAFAVFDMGDTKDATMRDGELTYVMTSPIALDSFARYASPSGDQIGRGALPPLAGETTKYWAFWNLRGTTNELTNVRIEGELGTNVTFTGRQTVSVNGGVIYDFTSNEIVWTATSVNPTFSPSSKIVGIAFELAITPSENQIGTIPTLLKNVRVIGTDAVTGAFVSASGATITTNLPDDAMAAGNATVE